ncbi:Kinase-like protein [Mycena indigotica]|uniref:non-specific serine/threonine protein kinase n=1 Tax=Mycena indigotica TaxID=2126181 RepID=A0A8H6VPJ9_9AGAR|nr:Kinase-like protein [Mycena indigotica]KAF7289382.1 Kinase-like protein [Mycena indigotica]
MTITHYEPTTLGATLNGGRYAVLRKLGEGITAVTWLVHDLSMPENRLKYFAAKIFSVEATAEHNGPARERNILQAILDSRDSEQGPIKEGQYYIPHLYDGFNEGPHLCLIMSLYSTSVAALRRSGPNKCLPVYMVRSIIHMTLHALGLLHDLKIVHTDVKADNILFTNARFSAVQELKDYLEQYPSQFDSQPQPLPHDFAYNSSAFQAELITVALLDYSHAQSSEGVIFGMTCCSPALRPPEVLLSSGFGPAVDIWAVGCLTFELLVGQCLFHPEDGGDSYTLEDDLLAQMQDLTGQQFSADVLARAKNRAKYFDAQGDLLRRRIPKPTPLSIEQMIRNHNIAGLAEEDIKESAEFIQACLQLDDRRRFTAKELLEYSFADKAWLCE